MTQTTLRAALLIALCTAAAPAPAQTQRSGGGESQKIMQQYQQLAAEKTALQAQATQMKKDLDAAKSELAAVTKERDALKAQSGNAAAATAQSVAARQAAEKSLEQYKQRMTELVGRYRDTATTLRDVESDRTKLRNDLKERASLYDKCAEDNLGLYEINDDLLNRYEHVGLFTKVGAAEPFTRITRTRIDNLVDEYRARALELRAKKSE
jgi:DNA repair exonuclease SbcCD ATPase subunit